MSRPFDFSRKTINDAFFRQWNLCAHCGTSLINIEDHGHHIMPNQSGNPLLSSDDWIRSVNNCVVLCDACHYAAHAYGNTRTGAVPMPDFFVYSHGPQKSEHQAWVIRMEAFMRGKGWV